VKLRDNILLILFFLSGATGLIYEIVWAKQLSLVFGVTIYAITTVLAVFFSGLALGSLWLGKLADKTKNPLKLYALIEVLIGSYALLTPTLFKLIENWQTQTQISWNYSGWSLIRFLISFLTLILPAILIGGTLPIIIKHFSLNRIGFGKIIARLYGLNTFGAIIGVISAGFFLIPSLGIKETNSLAALISLLIGMIALALASKTKVVKPKQKIVAPSQFYGKAKSLKIVFLAFFLSGLSALALEIIWTRMLILTIGISTYAFSIILATFLAGIALGSFLIKSVIEKIDPLKTFSLLEFTRGVVVILLIPIFSKLPYWYFQLIQKDWSFKAGTIVSFGVTALILLLPTTLMGMTFPVVSKIVINNFKNLGTSVGKAYFFNTLGGVVGSLIAGFTLIPLLGMQKSIVLIASLYFLAATILNKNKALMAIFGVAMLILGLWLPDWDINVLQSGLFFESRHFLDKSVEEVKKIVNKHELIYHQEGISSLIGVSKDNQGISLLINGKSQSDSIYDARQNLMLGHLSMLSHNRPKKVLLVGLGTGVTLGAIEQYPELEQVIVVELEPEIISAAKYFNHINNQALKDPRLKIVNGDGRNYLLISNQKFDVITSEPSHLWIKGMANLYTKEYFELAKKHLTENGIMVQWMQTNTLTQEDFKSFVNTFQSVFPETSMWETLGSVFLVGSTNKVNDLNIKRLNLINENETIRQDLIRANIDSPAAFLSHFVTSSKALRHWSKTAKLHTDNRPFLEFNTPKSFYNSQTVFIKTLKLINQLRQIAPLEIIILAEIALAQGNYNQSKKYWEKALKFKPESREALDGLNYITFLLNN
jgi:spermidine synthase